MRITDLNNFIILEIEAIDQLAFTGSDFLLCISLKLSLKELIINTECTILKKNLLSFLDKLKKLKLRGSTQKVEFTDIDNRIDFIFYFNDNFYIEGKIASVNFDYVLNFDQQIDLFNVDKEIEDLLIIINAFPIK